MPGATTARLVVWDSEMPMNEFMMPHTVPNRPTKGAVAPMVARMPTPREIRRVIAASTRSSRSATRFLKPSSTMPSDSLASRAVDVINWATASASVDGLGEAAVAFQHPQAPPGEPLRDAEFDGLGKPDRPGHQRGKCKPDHDHLHHDVGVEEHAPWRQIVRE